jgi:hypothetical protein
MSFPRRYAEPDKAGLGMEVEAGWPVPYWDLDAAMAVMLLLTAVDEGVGGWFFGVFHGAEALLRDLGLPPGRRLVGAVALGLPAVGDPPSDSAHTRPLDQVVHRAAGRRAPGLRSPCPARSGSASESAARISSLTRGGVWCPGCRSHAVTSRRANRVAAAVSATAR